MTAKLFRAKLRPVLVSTAAVLVAFAAFGVADPARGQFANRDKGYVGYSYLQIDGVNGDWRGAEHRNWISVDAHYWWNSRGRPLPAPRAAAPAQAQAAQANRPAAPAAAPAQRAPQAQAESPFDRPPSASVPGAPRTGEGTLVLSIDKHNPSLAALMQRCADHTTMPQVAYSVSTQRSRKFPEFGPTPASMPANFEYRLRNVQFIDCPVVEGAPEQAIVVSFSDIDWLNWQNEASSMPVTLEPAELAPLPRNLSGETRAWVLTWFAMANDVSDDQCPVMHVRPPVEAYYSLLPPEEAERESAALAGQGGPSYENGQMGLRGPHRLNVTMLPGIVPDPGLPEPQTPTARGINLDGSASSRHHRNYASEDGSQTGIDNQLYTVMGCIAGWQGHNGFILQFANNQMRDGQMSILVEVSGIDNDQNDREVYVTTLYSLDPMAKSASGSEVLSDFTFHVTDRPQFTHYFSRLRGRIVDGVIVTDPVENYSLNLGVYGNPPELQLADARMRLEIRPDGTLHGVVGGYRDWRAISSTYVASTAEFYHGFQQPALYNSLRRNADGLRNPVTGEYDGISTAYDMEGTPAFVVHRSAAVAQTNTGAGGGN